MQMPMRVRSITAVVLVLAVGGVAGAWASDVLVRPVPDVLASPSFTMVESRQDSVSQSFRLNASAGWSSEPVAANLVAGTVTSIDLTDGDEVEPGDTLFRVDLRPVVVAEGDVPAFRELAQGDRGDDVAQLQELLIELDYYRGAPDGRFTNGVHWAVRAWQRDLGVTTDGVLRQGDVAFVPELPARLALSDEIAVGAVLAGGEAAILALADEPSFAIGLPDGQARSVRTGQLVEVDHGEEGDPWLAEIATITEDAEFGGLTAELAGIDGESICRDECASIPLGDPTLYPSEIQVVPETSGVVIPAAALGTDASGAVGVVLESGEFHPVEVVESVSGLAVVEDLDVGVRVRSSADVDGEAS
jgi:peptidoglycan hydrolase-like protein with peptidoglycan-binding domain